MHSTADLLLFSCTPTCFSKLKILIWIHHPAHFTKSIFPSSFQARLSPLTVTVIQTWFCHNYSRARHADNKATLTAQATIVYLLMFQVAETYIRVQQPKVSILKQGHYAFVLMPRQIESIRSPLTLLVLHNSPSLSNRPRHFGESIWISI